MCLKRDSYAQFNSLCVGLLLSFAYVTFSHNEGPGPELHEELGIDCSFLGRSGYA